MQMETKLTEVGGRWHDFHQTESTLLSDETRSEDPVAGSGCGSSGNAMIATP
jgi:hypothetical protein